MSQLFYEPAQTRRDELKIRRPADYPKQPPEATAAAARVIAAWKTTRAAAAQHADWEPAGLWAPARRPQHRMITESLNRGNPAWTAHVLERTFSSNVSAGLSMKGELGYLTDDPGLFLDWWADGMLSFATYLGLIPEMMDTGEAILPASLAGLWDSIEATLGVPLRFPQVCNAWGAELDGIVMPRTAWRHLHAAHVLVSQRPERVVEVGGGFGGVAYWAQQLKPGLAYTMYDIPDVAAVAGYFLIRAGLNVQLAGEPDAPVTVLPCWRIDDEPDLGCDIAFNQDGLPEMSVEHATHYLQVFDRIARAGFWSENQEGGQPWASNGGSLQLRLPDLDHVLVRLTKRDRHRSWMRRGYFETWYRP